MKKQFTIIPNMFDSNLLQVTKYVDGKQTESEGIFPCDRDYLKDELENEGWIYSEDINYLQGRIEDYKERILSLCNTIGKAMESGNFILEFEEEEK